MVTTSKTNVKEAKTGRLAVNRGPYDQVPETFLPLYHRNIGTISVHYSALIVYIPESPPLPHTIRKSHITPTDQKV